MNKKIINFTMPLWSFYGVCFILFTLGLLYLTWGILTNEAFRIIVSFLHFAGCGIMLYATHVINDECF